MKLDERRETKDERLCHPERSEGSMHLRVILSPFDKLRVNSVEESLNTSLRGRSEPATSEAWWWQSMEGVC